MLACILLCGFCPSYEGFNQESEDKWGEGVSLDRASHDLKEACPSVKDENFCVCCEVYVCNYYDEVFRYA
jgi:hypothetical protein